MKIKVPAPRPCQSCPYRRDVPSGVWHPEEYEKLSAYDLGTSDQPPSVFMCHQQDGRLCAGWVAVHDMDNSLALRLAAIMGQITPDQHDRIIDYRTPVALFGSGAEAAEHGMADIENPSPEARVLQAKIERRLV